MLIAQEAALMEIFREQAAARKRELRFYEDSEQNFQLQATRERREEEQRRDLERLEAATSQQIGIFRDRLDRYDTAVVEALMENDEALRKARHNREDIEANAYRLPDGRMVFKADDGTTVLDKNGTQISRDVIDPGSIPTGLPKAGEYRRVVAEENRLLKERDALHDYQQKLDHARDTIDKGGVTKQQLDALGDDLEKSMPEAVGRKVGRESPGPDRDALQLGTPQPATPSGPMEDTRRRPEAFAMSAR